MGWPKGKPRKGYVKKNGKPHAKRGGAIHVSATSTVKMTGHGVEEGNLWGYKGNSAVTEACPNCHYAYADGGYCSECGWTRAIIREPYGTHSGGRL
jgi:hypothetical protein